VKRVADSVHGTVEITEVERQLIDTAPFQRLRGVKQLGLAHLVFPGADYSRFTHCLGACHVTGRILDGIETNGDVQFSETERATYRAAALLHDIGHYPFSHATEDAVRNYYAATLTEPVDGPPEELGESEEHVAPLLHEDVGVELIQSAPIADVLVEHDLDPARLAAIVQHADNAPHYANIVSSDLDADRIDYLLRTAHHTGLPYGRIDLDYIVSMMRIDEDRRLCLDGRALRTAEHLLLARYFDYQQISYHKSVAGLELLLKDVLQYLIETQTVQCSAAAIRDLIPRPEWICFDDAYVSEQIRNLAFETTQSEHQDKALALIQRRGPKMILGAEFFERSDSTSRVPNMRRILEDKRPAWAARFGIPISHWYPWSISRSLMSISASVPAANAQDLPDDQFAQAVRIRGGGLEGGSNLVTGFPAALMSLLGDHTFRAIRLYVLLPSDAPPTLREEIRAAVSDDVGDHWAPALGG
jgi:uncharacterized protein